MRQALLATLALFSTASLAQVTLVAPHPINVEPAQVSALLAVCAQAYAQVSGQRVTVTEGSAAPFATETIELNVVGIGRTTLLSAIRKSAMGEPIHEANIEASTLDDAPVVCERLAVALVNKVSVQASRTHATVTDVESRKTARRLRSNRSLGAKVGLLVPVADGENLSLMGTVGFNAHFESGRWLHQLGAGLLIPAATPASRSYGGIGVEIGTNYLLTDTDFAPYVGAGLHPRLVFSGSVFNLVPYAQVGTLFSRSSSTRFFAELRVGQNVFPSLSQTAAPGLTNAAPVYPTELNFTVGLGF